MLAVAGHLNIESDLIPRIATGFCGGLSHTGGMCGAVSGGIMSISLVLGRTSPADKTDPCYPAVRLFMGRFAARFGSLSCLELTGVHLGTPEGQAAFSAGDKIEECTEYVAESTRLVVDILDKH